MTKRTDIHRAGAVIPSDYDYKVSYALASSVGGWPCPSINLDVVAKLHEQHPKAEYGGVGKCTLCGAVYSYGDVWQHRETQELIHVGHDCADKVGWVADRSEYDGLRLALVTQIKKEQKLFKLCHENQALFEAMSDGTHPVILDMRRKLYRYGSLSEKQEKYALALFQQEKGGPAPKSSEGAPEPTETWVAVTGNTYPVKDQIKALGGRWDGYERVWRVPASKAEEAQALVKPKGKSSEGAPVSEKPTAPVDAEAEAAALPF